MGEKPTDADELAAEERRRSGGTSMPAIQNIRRETAGGGQDEGADPADAARASLNSSRSNIYRQGQPGSTPEPAEATNLNSSKSNVLREGSPDPGAGPEPAEGTTVKSSKSNSSE